MSMRLILCILLLIAAASPARSEDRQVLFREEFSTLDKWQPFFFPKVKSHTTYTIEHDSDRHVLKTESNASASALIYKDSFDVREYPRVRWRWKVSNVYAKANPKKKEGDDYPLRVYIMFEYNPVKAGILELISYSLARSRYGEYPPHSSLSYVWSSIDDPETFVASPYTEKTMMVLLEKGPSKSGVWVDEEIDILADYRKAFKTEPPARARIAVMNDSDNTGESSVSFMEYLEVFR